MARARGDFTELLLRKQILSPDQLEEAKTLAAQTGVKLQEALVKLGYASQEQISSAIAEHSGMQFVDLTEVTTKATLADAFLVALRKTQAKLPSA